MTGSDRCLKSVWTECASEIFGALERSEATVDEELIPAAAILVEEQDGLASWANSRG
jgi:hypothetical protein